MLLHLSINDLLNGASPASCFFSHRDFRVGGKESHYWECKESNLAIANHTKVTESVVTVPLSVTPLNIYQDNREHKTNNNPKQKYFCFLPGTEVFINCSVIIFHIFSHYSRPLSTNKHLLSQRTTAIGNPLPI